MSSEHTVFVCSATGCRQLRELGWNVHATTRDLTSPAAVALRDNGVQLTEGDWDNTEASNASIAGCDKLFLCLLPNWDDPSCERRQNILKIAKEAGVRQVSQLDDNVRVAPGSSMEKHMINKRTIEQTVKDAGFEHYTFLRPTFFMANFLEPKVRRYAEIRDRRSWTTSMAPETQLPVVDHVDIGKFVAVALQNPETFYSRVLGLASDQMGIQKMLDMLAKTAGQPGSICALFMTDEEIEIQTNMSGFSNSHKALRTASDYVDMEERKAIVPLTSFREFLEREKELVKQTYH
ncbi:NAD(P)-binding protein [Jackrogersella minutella]|nr:NAD(P)-binding protein [Jackrogersella minutella]